MVDLLLLAAALALLLFVYPYLIYPHLLRLLPRRSLEMGQADRSGEAPTASLVFCAYNEEASLPAKIENIGALVAADPRLEVLAYSDGSSDRTLELLRAASPMIRVFHGETRQGKTHGMNTLISAARAPIVICSDANVTLSPGAPRAALAAFADPTVGCVCGHLTYTNDRDSETAAVGSAYWRLEERIKDLETATGSAVGADGSLFAVRRALYRPAPPDIIDDMFVSLSVLCDGHRVVKAPGFEATESAAVASGDEFRRKIRIACQAFNCHRLLWPRLRRLPAVDLFKYVSHKLVRWAGIYLLAIAALLAGLWLVLTAGGDLVVPLSAALVLSVVLLRAVRASLFRKARELLLALTATGWGLIRSLRGDRFQTWSIPESSRSGGATQG